MAANDLPSQKHLLKIPEPSLARSKPFNYPTVRVISNTMLGGVSDKDVHISLDDQKMINKFARQNQKLEEIKDELKVTEDIMF